MLRRKHLHSLELTTTDAAVRDARHQELPRYRHTAVLRGGITLLFIISAEIARIARTTKDIGKMYTLQAAYIVKRSCAAA